MFNRQWKTIMCRIFLHSADIKGGIAFLLLSIHFLLKPHSSFFWSCKWWMTIFMAIGQGLWHAMQVYQLFVMQEKRLPLLVKNLATIPCFSFFKRSFDDYSFIKFWKDYKDLRKLRFNFLLRRYIIAAQKSAGFKQGWRGSSRAKQLSIFYCHCCLLCFPSSLGSKEGEHLSSRQFVFTAHNFAYYCWSYCAL